jgi:hypothetical protein
VTKTGVYENSEVHGVREGEERGKTCERKAEGQDVVEAAEGHEEGRRRGQVEVQ